MQREAVDIDKVGSDGREDQRSDELRPNTQDLTGREVSIFRMGEKGGAVAENQEFEQS